MAAGSGRLEMARLLLEEFGGSVDVRDQAGGRAGIRAAPIPASCHSAPARWRCGKAMNFAVALKGGMAE